MMRLVGAVMVVGLAVLLGARIAAVKQASATVAATRSPAQVPTIGCGGVAMGAVTDGRDPGYRRVLGVVSAPPRYLANVGEDQAAAPFHFWTKAGLVIRAGAAVTVTIPVHWRSHVRITWGGERGAVLRFASCSLGTKWNGYAGGFLSRSRSVCVPLIFTVGSSRSRLVFGVGRRC
jgi:hypothetical protein